MRKSVLALKTWRRRAIPQIPVRLEMLKSGQIDAATLPEPLASVAVKAGATVISSTDNLGINPGALLFTKETIQSKNAEIAAFYRGLQQRGEVPAGRAGFRLCGYTDRRRRVSGGP